ncbi:hypothetical protein C8R44DRAFT_726834 [Mycena epipterygia]|nr:hypothetical protein C8R44DRAFT_726834 [Mycena epipterygia]
MYPQTRCSVERQAQEDRTEPVKFRLSLSLSILKHSSSTGGHVPTFLIEDQGIQFTLESTKSALLLESLLHCLLVHPPSSTHRVLAMTCPGTVMTVCRKELDGKTGFVRTRRFTDPPVVGWPATLRHRPPVSPMAPYDRQSTGQICHMCLSYEHWPQSLQHPEHGTCSSNGTIESLKTRARKETRQAATYSRCSQPVLLKPSPTPEYGDRDPVDAVIPPKKDRGRLDSGLTSCGGPAKWTFFLGAEAISTLVRRDETHDIVRVLAATQEEHRLRIPKFLRCFFYRPFEPHSKMGTARGMRRLGYALSDSRCVSRGWNYATRKRSTNEDLWFPVESLSRSGWTAALSLPNTLAEVRVISKNILYCGDTAEVESLLHCQWSHWIEIKGSSSATKGSWCVKGEKCEDQKIVGPATHQGNEEDLGIPYLLALKIQNTQDSSCTATQENWLDIVLAKVYDIFEGWVIFTIPVNWSITSTMGPVLPSDMTVLEEKIQLEKYIAHLEGN